MANRVKKSLIEQTDNEASVVQFTIDRMNHLLDTEARRFKLDEAGRITSPGRSQTCVVCARAVDCCLYCICAGVFVLPFMVTHSMDGCLP